MRSRRPIRKRCSMRSRIAALAAGLVSSRKRASRIAGGLKLALRRIGHALVPRIVAMMIRRTLPGGPLLRAVGLPDAKAPSDDRRTTT